MPVRRLLSRTKRPTQSSDHKARENKKSTVFFADLSIFPSGYRINTKTLLKPNVREFWEKLGSFVISLEEHGYVDIFVPLAASSEF